MKSGIESNVMLAISSYTFCVIVSSDAAGDREAVCVSHQLPTATLRRSLTDQSLPHLPTAANRMCNHASLTSFYFHDDALVGWSYAELAGQ